MDLDSMEAMNEIRPSVYRTAMKLLSLQRLCHMDNVFIRHIMAAFQVVDGAKLQDVLMSKEEVTLVLNRMFHRVSQEVPGQRTMASPEEVCGVIMGLFNNRSQISSVSACSLQRILVSLSADNLMNKYTNFVSVSGTGAGFISRCGLRSLLQDLNQLPAAVHEDGVFGGVEAAVKSCFNGVLTPTAKEEHVLMWLQSGPRLLLWLPTLYRLSVSQKISHAVRCHTCKTFPITGLRYRCMKCVNIHVCQSCFLTKQQTRKHKSHHPLLEFCTQPTWRESLSSLVQNARHALLPGRHTRRESDGRMVLMWEEPGETQDRVPPPDDVSTLVASPSSDTDNSPDTRTPPPTSSSSSKVPQTAEEQQGQQAVEVLRTEVRNLQRDKWLLEQQLQAWRTSVQSEQGILEDRCSEMEVIMETLRQHNVQLQGMLTQTLSKMATRQDTTEMPRSFDSDNTKTPESERNPQHEEEASNEGEEEEGRNESEEGEEEEERNEPEEREEEEERNKDGEEEEERNEDGEEEGERNEPEDGQEEDESNEEGEEEENDNKREEGEEEKERREEEEEREEEDEVNRGGEEDEEELIMEKHEWKTIENSSPTIHWDLTLSYNESPDMRHYQPIRQQNMPKGAGLQEKGHSPSEGEECRKCSPEELLQTAVDRLKTEMEIGWTTERQTGDTKRVELLKAAQQVGDRIHCLVDALRTY